VLSNRSQKIVMPPPGKPPVTGGVRGRSQSPDPIDVLSLISQKLPEMNIDDTVKFQVRGMIESLLESESESESA